MTQRAARPKTKGAFRTSEIRQLATQAKSLPKAAAKPAANAKSSTKTRPGTKAKRRRRSDTKARQRPKDAAIAKPGNGKAKPIKTPKDGKVAVALLSGGNPQIAKAYGDAPVQAYIAAMPGWKRDVGRRLDAIIVRTVADVHKAVKWNSPFYGIEGNGWFLSFHCFTKYVKVAFFRGASLHPVPPGKSKQKGVRYLDIHEDDQIDEAQFAAWVQQASRLPGERM